MRRRFLPFVLVLGIVGNDALAGDPSAPQSRDFRLEGVPVTELQNDCPGFQLRLSANRDDLIYEEGEEFELQIQASEACYVHLFNINPQLSRVCNIVCTAIVNEIGINFYSVL